MRIYTRAAAALALTFVFATAAWAGRLDPRLSALTTGGHSFVRASAAGAVTAGSRARAASPMLPRVRSNQTVQVYIHPSAPHGPLPTAAALRMVHASGIRASSALGVVQAWVPISQLSALANLPGVGLVTVPAYARVAPPPRPAGSKAATTFTPAAATPPSGLSIDAAAVLAMQADKLQAVGAKGTGIKIGVISDDNSGLAASQSAGYLPAVVWADPTFPGTSPTPGDPAEGTAMLEEVHAMAPGASLGFCAPQTSVDFITCYQDFATWGATVIADDLGFSPIDEFSIGSSADNTLAYATNQFTQAHPNIAITSSAGNDAQNYFESPYVAGPAVSFGGTGYASVMDFGLATGGTSNTQLPVGLPANYTFVPVLEWNDVPSSSPDQFVLYLVDASGNILAQGSAFSTPDDGRAADELVYTTGSSSETDYLMIACQSCANPATLKLDGLGNGAVGFGTYTAGSENGGQKVANGVLATAAVWLKGTNPLSLNRESYSDIGPFTYGDYSNQASLSKPQLAGIDDVVVSGAGGFGYPRSGGGAIFCGTSATGPNVGALIASLMQAMPGRPASDYYSALEQSANQTAFTTATSGECGASNMGYSQQLEGSGLARGFAALSSVFTFPATAITKPVDVPNASTATVTVPVNVNVTYAATVASGSNAASASNCIWTADGAATQTGASVIYVATAPGTAHVVANCADDNGISSPTPPRLTISAQNIPAPTVAATAGQSETFALALTGHEPLTLKATSNNTSVFPNSGIALSPSGCGTSTLNCTLTLSPSAKSGGSATITITATDAWNRSASKTAKATYALPTAAISGASSSGFSLTLTGDSVLTLTATSSNTSVLPNSGISISPSTCGSSTLSCTVSLSPASKANGSATVTITATDSWGGTDSAQQSVSYSYSSPTSGGGSSGGGGGGAFAWIDLVGLALLTASCYALRRKRPAPRRSPADEGSR